MQIRVTGRHMDVTAALRDHVESRLRKLEHIFHNLLDAHAILFIEKDDHVVDITVTGNHLTLHVRERAADMYVAADQAIHRLESQVRRHKERVTRRKKRERLTHVERDLQAAAVAEQEFEGLAETEEPAAEGVVAVAIADLHRYGPAGPMTLEEALAEFEENGEDFFAFINLDHQGVEVLFRDTDGRPSLITQH